MTKKFHTDDVALQRSVYQRRYMDLCRAMSSTWEFFGSNRGRLARGGRIACSRLSDSEDGRRKVKTKIKRLLIFLSPVLPRFSLRSPVFVRFPHELRAWIQNRLRRIESGMRKFCRFTQVAKFPDHYADSCIIL